MPDIEAVCVAALRSADVAEERVYGRVPADPDFPLVLVQRVGGTPVDRRRLDFARIQLSCYGTDKASARDTAEEARVALLSAEATAFPDLNAYVTGVEVDLGLQYLPDPETARDRYILVMSVTAHHHEAPEEE